jgi:hypothetical protein
MIIMADTVKKLDSSEHGYATRNDLRLVARIQDKFYNVIITCNPHFISP